MRVFDSIPEVRSAVCEDRRVGRVGLVPTMGALHAGHRSLVERSVELCQRTYVTIFLNPTQFAEGEDLSRYPRTIESDLAMLRRAGVDGVFTPDTATMYGPAGETANKSGESGPSNACRIIPPSVAANFEGRSRPTHFAGVCTVVAKLFNILPATDAFFGKKDYQQWRVIETMARQLNFDIAIHGCEIVRDADGLALSSRNVYLDDAQRQRALTLSKTLAAIRSEFDQREFSAGELTRRMNQILEAGLSPRHDQVHYAVIAARRDLTPLGDDAVVVPDTAVALIAATVGTTRLIDNREL